MKRSTISKGREKTNNIANAAAYSLRHAKLNSPPNSCTAARREVARKNNSVKQKTLKVMIRCTQVEKNPSCEFASPTFFCGGKKACSTSRATPWIAPKTTYVQFAPCQSPARTMVIRRFLLVFHLPPVLPPSGIY